MAHPSSLSLVLPCYNEAASLPGIVARALASAQRRGLTPESSQLILVNNGSTDDSDEVLRRLSGQLGGEFLDVVTLAQNRGYGDGLAAGLRASRFSLVAWTHADEQCDPEDVFRARDLWLATEINRAGKILVKGMRRGRSMGEWCFSRAFETIASLALGMRLSEVNAQPKLFPRVLIERLTHPPDGFAFDLYVLAEARKAGFLIHTIPVRFPPRPRGESKWSATFRSRWRTIRRVLEFLWRYRLEASGGH